MIYTSSFPPVKATEWRENETVFEFLFVDNPRISRNDIAIIDAFTGVETSYGQLIDSSLKLAHGLVHLAGLKPQQTVGIFSPNTSLYCSIIFGAQAAGLTVSTANSSYTAVEVAHQLKSGSASLLFVSEDLISVAHEAILLAKLDLKVYILPGVGSEHVASELPHGYKSYTELLGSKKLVPVKLTKEQLKTAVAYLPFSSGTTGVGKGVSITHRNIISIGQQLGNVTDMFKRDIVLGILPLYHIYGLVCLLHQTLFNGGTIVLMPRFDLKIFLECVEKYNATVSYVVPPVALHLAKHPLVDSYDLSSLRFLISGAAPLSAELQATLERRLDNAPKRKHKSKTIIVQGYGMTETTAVALLPTLSNTRIGSCGQLLPSMEARLVDENGKDVKAGESGELWLRGRNIMLGYHENAKATESTVNRDGWLMTGDVCIRSEDGFYSIVDRTKELIKYKGFQVAPATLEGLLLQSDLVDDCAVIGVWVEEQATELPRAYIVASDKFKSDASLAGKIVKFIDDQVPPHMKLRGGVRFIDVIPKSAAGKILRKDLRVLAAKELAEGPKVARL